AGAANGNVFGYLLIRLLVPGDNIAGHLRIDQAGIDGVHADAVLDVFESRRSCQADNAVLGRDVGADTGVTRQRTDRCVVDDGAAALAFHLPQLVLHRAPHAAQVDPDHAIPLFARALGRWGDAGHNACIVEGGVEPAEFGNGVVHHLLDLSFVAYVAVDGDRLEPGGCELLGFRFHQVLS